MDKPLERICKAALQCFGEQGIQNTSMDDIAKLAKIARPNLYRYVSDRDDLISKVALQRAAEFTAALADTKGSWEDCLTEIFVKVILMGREDRLIQMLVEQAAPMASRLMTNPDSGLISALNPVIIPLLDKAVESGRLRPGLTRKEIIWWIHFQAWSFARERDLIGQIDLQALVSKFIIGALVVDPVAEAQ